MTDHTIARTAPRLRRFHPRAAGESHARRRRPADRDTPPHARPAPRRAGAALRPEHDLVHLDRAGPRRLGLAAGVGAARGALELGRAARAYLFELAGRRDPDRSAPTATTCPLRCCACVEAIAAPAYILDRYWNARAWNGAAARLFVGWLDQPGESNLLRFTFGASRGAVTDLRLGGARPPPRRGIPRRHQRPPRRSQIARADRRVAPRQTGIRPMLEPSRRLGARRRRADIQSPTDGFLRYQQVTFDLASQPDLKLTMLVRQET